MLGTSMKIDLPYLSAETDRHGRSRIYVRRFGRRVAIREVPGTVAFNRAYEEALAILAPKSDVTLDPAAETLPGSMGELALAYFSSAEFQGLDPISQTTRQGIIEHCLRELVNKEKPDSPPMRDVPVPTFAVKHVRELRDRKADKPAASRNRLKYLSAMFSWAIEARHEGVAGNPARDVKPLEYVTEGFHSWAPEEVTAFEAFHPIGSKARLAMALLLFTGARRGDVVTFGRQHVKAGKLRYVPRKTRHKRVKTIVIPMLPGLLEIIDKSPTGDLTFLVTEYGRPYTAAGFGNWFRERCDDAGLSECSAHGLRKAGATILAERGATAHQLMSIYGWSTINQATTYTAAADQERLAGALEMMERPNGR